MHNLRYEFGNQLDLATVIQLYRDSTLGERRPVEDVSRMATMLAQANLVWSAWTGTKLVGIARGLSDFAYCTYLSDLAVHAEYQRQGIGRELLQRVRDSAPSASLILLAAPRAVDYYPRLGFRQHPSAWLLRPEDALLSPS